VVEYAGVGAALGLHPLPQDADVVNVEVGHPADADVAEADEAAEGIPPEDARCGQCVQRRYEA